jgi:hypothetical protein
MGYGNALRTEVHNEGTTPLIGIFDMYSASLTAQHYGGMFVSGFGFAASYYGLPDIGFIAWPDMVNFVQRLRLAFPQQHLLLAAVVVPYQRRNPGNRDRIDHVDVAPPWLLDRRSDRDRLLWLEEIAGQRVALGQRTVARGRGRVDGGAVDALPPDATDGMRLAGSTLRPTRQYNCGPIGLIDDLRTWR